MPTIPPIPTEAMLLTEQAERELAHTRLFLEELLEVARGQVAPRDLPVIAAYIRQNPKGLWTNYEGENTDSQFNVHDVEFLDADGVSPDRVRVVFKCMDERTGEWDVAGEEMIPLS